jgi:pSer/pThr/pTyr-binding forkhead associated (FHA) protein
MPPAPPAITSTVAATVTSAVTPLRAYLLARGGPLSGQRVALGEQPVSIGRDPLDCTMLFPADATVVSRLHATVRQDVHNDQLLLRDEGSRNGTFLQTCGRLDDGVEYPLAFGQPFWCGDPSCVFVVERDG